MEKETLIALMLNGNQGGGEVSGNINITDTQQTDVSAYATAQVVDANLTAANIAENVEILGITGTHKGQPAKGLVFGDYDSDGYPHSAEFVGTWTSIPNYFYKGTYNTFAKYVDYIEIPDSVTTIGNSAFEASSITTVVIPDSVTSIGSDTFYGGNLTEVHMSKNCNITNRNFRNAAKVELYDFSRNETVPTLYSVDSLGHKENCVIKVPSALLSTWQAATNWADLTDVVWQGV